MNKEQIIEAIKSMTVLELNELVKAVEAEFGVTAAVAAAAAPAEEEGPGQAQEAVHRGRAAGGPGGEYR